MAAPAPMKEPSKPKARPRRSATVRVRSSACAAGINAAPNTAWVARPRTTNAKVVANAVAIDAAAKVLGETQETMTAKQMIERMAAKGYWTSPGGKTPSATLYAAVIREIQRKGDDSRFQKADRGLFTLNAGK